MATQSDASQSRLPLTKERVLRAAIAIADRGGVDSLTMRNIGQELGVEAMSLYNHVANKGEILDGLVDLVMGEIALAPHDTDWKTAMRRRAHSAREVLMRHPWAAKLFESRLELGPARRRQYEAMVGSLRRAGFPIALAYHACMTLDSYLYGFVMQELTWPYEKEDRPEVVAPLTAQVPADEFPYLTEVMGYIMGPGAAAPHDYSEEFAFGLELILDGLGRALEAGGPG